MVVNIIKVDKINQVNCSHMMGIFDLSSSFNIIDFKKEKVCLESFDYTKHLFDNTEDFRIIDCCKVNPLDSLYLNCKMDSLNY